jgi:hypothetical protein
MGRPSVPFEFSLSFALGGRIAGVFCSFFSGVVERASLLGDMTFSGGFDVVNSW